MAEPATDFIQVTVPTKNVNENGESQSKQLIYDRNRYSVKPERAYVKNTTTTADDDPEASTRDVFKATRNEDDQKVFIKSVSLKESNRVNAWRELMCGTQLDYKNIVKIVDNWVVLNESGPERVFFVIENHGAESIRLLTRKEGKLKMITPKDKGGKIMSPLKFSSFLKIFQDILAALVVMKQQAILHRDIIMDNVVVDDINKGADLTATLIDFGYAKQIVSEGMTVGVGSTIGKVAPEILLRVSRKQEGNKAGPKVCQKPYDFQVDIYALGIMLLDLIEVKPTDFTDFFKTKVLGHKSTGNIRADQSYFATMFSYFCDEYNLSEEQKQHMIKPDPTVNFSKIDRAKDRMNKFIEHHKSKGVNFGDENSSFSKKSVFYFMRHLQENLGWTEENKKLVADSILAMMNYWPDKRPTAEDLLFGPMSKLFEIQDANGETVLRDPKRSDLNQYNPYEGLSQVEGQRAADLSAHNLQLLLTKIANSAGQLSLLTKKHQNLDKLNIIKIAQVQNEIRVSDQNEGDKSRSAHLPVKDVVQTIQQVRKNAMTKSESVAGKENKGLFSKLYKSAKKGLKEVDFGRVEEREEEFNRLEEDQTFHPRREVNKILNLNVSEVEDLADSFVQQQSNFDNTNDKSNSASRTLTRQNKKVDADKGEWETNMVFVDNSVDVADAAIYDQDA